MLASNQPYGRVTEEDGLLNGFLAGGAMGAAGTGAAHYGVNRLGASDEDRNARYSKQGASQKISSGKARRAVEPMRESVQAMKSKAPSGWKGKAAAYGGSVLLGGIMGATMDSFQDGKK